jgi:hypothetical protein
MDKETQDQQLEITKSNGRTQIVFRKASLKGTVTSQDVLKTVLIAARMQAEKYIDKLSRGAPLDPAEVKCLKDLAEITKLDVAPSQTPTLPSENMDKLKSTLYQALSQKLSDTVVVDTVPK